MYWINQRRYLARHKNVDTYFKPDDNAVYAATHEIDIGNVESFLAKYPKPDDVVPIEGCEGIRLDSCFDGACTTAEEDLILGALIQDQGLRQGKMVEQRGVKKVVPGSMPIHRKLRKLGLIDI